MNAISATATGSPIARLTGIKKSYPGVKALKGVDFEIHGAEIHCLVGENGAGKSTLMRILTGAAQPDEGSILLDGEAVALSPASAIERGIGIVHQELDLIPALSIAENIFLGHEPVKSGFLVDWNDLKSKATELLSLFELNLTPDMLVRDLAPAQQQMVQIAKALSHKNRILILDEPTASLSTKEVEHLFAVLRRLRAQGLGMVYISHRLEEVLELGDRLTVFRDGSHIVTAPVRGMTQPDIIKAMVGRSLGEQFPRSSHTGTEIALTVEGLGRRGEFNNINFSVKKGEVLALAGIVGAGRSELLETLFGIRRPHAGRISIGGIPASFPNPQAAIAAGLGLVPEERRESGLVLGRSVGDNLIYPMLDRVGSMLHLDHRKIAQTVDRFIGKLSIKTPNARTRSGTLSGGNQQKIVIGKWLASGVQILLLDEPTRGVDVNAKAEIYRLIDELAQSGVAVIVASSELPEVLGISDRVLVLAAGQQMTILDTDKTSQEEIMHHAVGSAQEKLS